MKLLVYCIIISVLVEINECVRCDIEPKTDEGRLRKYLFCNYDTSNRPTKSGPTIINIRMVVKGFQFQDSASTLTISTWLSMKWNDEYLKWSPSEYGNRNSIIEESDQFWSPDLALFNSDIASATDNSVCKPSNCIIDSTGLISCIPACMIQARCSSNFRRWPFDTQNCTVHLGAWVHSGDDVDYILQKSTIPDSNLLSQSKRWRLIEATYQRNPGNYSQTKDAYPSLEFSFTIERHSATYAAFTIVPALMLSIINLISLWLAPGCTSRVMIALANIFFHILFVQQLSWNAPNNGDDLPDVDSLLISVLLLLNCIAIQGISQCGYEVPNWVNSSTDYLKSNKMGQVFFSNNYLVEREPLHSEEATETPTPIETKRISNPWITLAKIIDRLCFILLCVVYTFMVFAMLPEGYLKKADHNEVVIVGY